MCYTFVVVVDGGFGGEVWKSLATVMNLTPFVIPFDSAEVSCRGGIDSIQQRRTCSSSEGYCASKMSLSIAYIKLVRCVSLETQVRRQTTYPWCKLNNKIAHQTCFIFIEIRKSMIKPMINVGNEVPCPRRGLAAMRKVR